MTVLRNGRLVGEYQTATLDKVTLIAAMLGHELELLEEIADTVARVADASEHRPCYARGTADRRRRPAPLRPRRPPGEVVGLAGLLGSGRTELARLIFGVDRATAVRFASPASPRS